MFSKTASRTLTILWISFLISSLPIFGLTTQYSYADQIEDEAVLHEELGSDSESTSDDTESGESTGDGEGADEGSSTEDETPVYEEVIVVDENGLKRFLQSDGTYLVSSWLDWEGDRYYFNADGYAVRYGQKIDGSFYYFNADYTMRTGWVTWIVDERKSYFEPETGAALIGWQELDGKTYYFEASTGKSLRYGQKIDGEFYYFNADSTMRTGWTTWIVDERKSYFDPETGGKASVGWKTIGDNTYYFRAEDAKSVRYNQHFDGNFYYFNYNGTMHTGLLKWVADERMSYFDPETGAALVGWREIDGKTYYFEPSTYKSLRYGQNIDGYFYYFKSDSTMHTGLITWNSDGRRSYFDPENDGKASVGWKTVRGYTYYFRAEDARSVRYNQHFDGNFYYFNYNGTMHTGLLKWVADERYSYFDPETGTALVGWQEVDGKTYYFEASTYKSLHYAQTIDGNTYYFNKDGSMHTGWLNNGDATYSYYGVDGALCIGSCVINGKTYELGDNGVIAASEVDLGTSALVDIITSVGTGKTLRTFNTTYSLSSDAGTMLKEELSDLISYGIGFIMIDLTTGEGVSYNAGQQFFCASTIKGPYVASVCEYRASKVTSSIKSTMKKTITVSSNSGYASLRSQFGSAPLKKLMSATDATSISTSVNYPDISSKNLLKLWIGVYEYFYEDTNSLSSWCRGLYTDTKKSYIAAELNSTYTVHTKPGWMASAGPYQGIYNDAGIIMAGDRPYAVAILSKAHGHKADLQDLVEAIDIVHQDMIKAR